MTAPTSREELLRIVHYHIESALRWHEVFDDGRGGNNLTLQETADLIAGRLVAALPSPAQTSVRAIVNEQAEDDALWCLQPTVTEHLLQQALRRLHHAIEGTPPDSSTHQSPSPVEPSPQGRPSGSGLKDGSGGGEANSASSTDSEALAGPNYIEEITGPVNSKRWEVGKNGWDASDEMTREDI